MEAVRLKKLGNSLYQSNAENSGISRLMLSSAIGNQAMYGWVGDSRKTIQRKVRVDNFPDKKMSTELTHNMVDSILLPRADKAAMDESGFNFLLANMENYDYPDAGSGPYSIESVLQFLYESDPDVVCEKIGEKKFRDFAPIYAIIAETDGLNYSERLVHMAALYDDFPWRDNMAASSFSGESLIALIDKEDEYRFSNYGQLDRFLSVKMRQANPGSQDGGYQVDVMNVGQGTSVLVTNSQSANYGLIDVGPNVENVPDFLSRKKNKKIHPTSDVRTGVGISHEKVTTVITHPHDDHYAGGNPIKDLPWAMVGEQHGEVSYAQTDDADKILQDAGGLAALSIARSTYSEDENDDSLVTFLETPTVVFLFPGDRGVDDLLSAPYRKDLFLGKGVVLVASHHGSDTGTNSALINYFYNKGAVDVDIIISAGIGNQFSHPSARELRRPGAKAGIPPDQGETLPIGKGNGYQVYSTQNLGNSIGSVSVKADQEGYSVYSKKKKGEISLSAASNAGMPVPFENELYEQMGSLDTALSSLLANMGFGQLLQLCYYYSKKEGHLPWISEENKAAVKRRLSEKKLTLESLKKSISLFYSGFVAKCQKRYMEQSQSYEGWQDLVDSLASDNIGKLTGEKEKAREARKAREEWDLLLGRNKEGKWQSIAERQTERIRRQHKK